MEGIETVELITADCTLVAADVTLIDTDGTLVGTQVATDGTLVGTMADTDLYKRGVPTSNFHVCHLNLFLVF